LRIRFLATAARSAILATTLDVTRKVATPQENHDQDVTGIGFTKSSGLMVTDRLLRCEHRKGSFWTSHDTWHDVQPKYDITVLKKMQNALTSTSGKTTTRTSSESDSLYSSGLMVTDRLPRDEEKFLNILKNLE
jgi:hypothetical protein